MPKNDCRARNSFFNKRIGITGLSISQLHICYWQICPTISKNIINAQKLKNNNLKQLSILYCSLWLCNSKSCYSKPFCFSFVYWLMVSFLHCSLYSYHSSNYCVSDRHSSFLPLKWKLKTTIAKDRRAITIERERNKEAKKLYKN